MARILEEQGEISLPFNVSNFLQCSREEKMCQRRMIYWAIISFHPLLSECGQQRSRLNYICRVLRMSFLLRIHNFPVTREAALLSFCTTSVIFTLPFSAHTRCSLTEDCLLHQVTKIIASTLCMFIQSPGSLFASPLIVSCWFYPGLSAPQNIKYLMCGTIFPPFSSSHTFLVSSSASWQTSHKKELFWALLPQEVSSHPSILSLHLFWSFLGSYDCCGDRWRARKRGAEGKLCFGFSNYSDFIFAAWECWKSVCMEHPTVPSVESQSHFSPANMINWELQGMGWLVGTSSMCKQTATWRMPTDSRPSGNGLVEEL